MAASTCGGLRARSTAAGRPCSAKGGQSPRLNGRKIAGHAILGDSAVVLPADKGNMLRPAIEQMLRSNFAAPPVIMRREREQIDPRIPLAQDLHHGQARSTQWVKDLLSLRIGG